MDPMYLLAQTLGILTAVICLILPLWKHKWQMLVCNILSNVFAGINIFLLGQAGAVSVYVVAVIQAVVTLWHVKRKKPITKGENILFFFLYVGCGLAGLKKPLDLMPIFGAVFNMLSTFQLDEQRSRWFLLINVLVFNVYYFIIGSTAVFSTIIATVTTIAALYRYRNGKRTTV